MKSCVCAALTHVVRAAGHVLSFDCHAKPVLGRTQQQGGHDNVSIRYHRLWMLAGLALLGVFYMARPATAEMYVGLYGSYGMQISKFNPTIRAGTAGEEAGGMGLEVTLKDVDADNFLTGGLRL